MTTRKEIVKDIKNIIGLKNQIDNEVIERICNYIFNRIKDENIMAKEVSDLLITIEDYSDEIKKEILNFISK